MPSHNSKRNRSRKGSARGTSRKADPPPTTAEKPPSLPARVEPAPLFLPDALPPTPVLTSGQASVEFMTSRNQVVIEGFGVRVGWFRDKTTHSARCGRKAR